MEPVSIEPTEGNAPRPAEPGASPKPQKGKGRKGSLENPEVYENVPGHVIPIITRAGEDAGDDEEDED